MRLWHGLLKDVIKMVIGVGGEMNKHIEDFGRDGLTGILYMERKHG
jgi:hypothetical protein